MSATGTVITVPRNGSSDEQNGNSVRWNVRSGPWNERSGLWYGRVPTLVCRLVMWNFAYYGMQTTIRRQIGKRVREQREALGLSQEELAHKSGSHRTYIGMIERAEKSVGVERLVQICRALQTNISDLLKGL